jgi:hypothetical protein
MTINRRKVDMNYPVKESISLSIHIHKWIIINHIIPLEFRRILVSKRSNPFGAGNLNSTNSRLHPLEIIQIRSSVNLLGKSTTAFLFVSYIFLYVFVVPPEKTNITIICTTSDGLFSKIVEQHPIIQDFLLTRLFVCHL